MDQLRASHILVKTEGEARDLLAEIENGALFADLARTHSLCPSGEQGGDLGWFSKGMMVAEFDALCQSLTEGELGGPVRTQFGYHLILLTGRRD